MYLCTEKEEGLRAKGHGRTGGINLHTHRSGCVNQRASTAQRFAFFEMLDKRRPYDSLARSSSLMARRLLSAMIWRARSVLSVRKMRMPLPPSRKL